MIDESKAIEAYINTPKTVDFYKEAFSKYTISGIDKFSWQWSWWAMFGGMFYLLYRKLYVEAFVYFILFSMSGIISIAWFSVWTFSGDIWPFFIVLWILFSGSLLPFLVYKRYKNSKIKVLENISSEEDKYNAIKVLGGINTWAIWLGVAVFMLLCVSVSFFVIVVTQIPC